MSRLSLVPAGVMGNVRAAAAELVDAAARAAHPVRNVWGYLDSPDHNNRRCVDYMVTAKEHGDWIASYFWTHRKRLGLDLLIWNRRIRRTYRKGLIPAGAWAPYFGASAHRDHVHVQLAHGPYRPPTARFLGPYVVDPAKVSTFLWQVRPNGTRGAKRRPGTVIRSGVSLVDLDGRTWLLTQAGNRYAMEFLTLWHDDPTARSA